MYNHTATATATDNQNAAWPSDLPSIDSQLTAGQEAPYFDNQIDEHHDDASDALKSDSAAPDDLAAGDSESPAPDADATAIATLEGQEQPVTEATFASLLDAINQCKVGYRQIHTKLFVALYTAWIAFSTAPKADRKKNEKALDDQCAEQGITATTYRLKLAQMAFGTNPQRASAKTRVIKILESLHVAPDQCGQWLANNGGFEAVRTGFNTDGTKKGNAATSKSANVSKSVSNDDNARYISKAKAALATSIKATIPTGQLDKIGPNIECAAILRQQADGSFVVVAVLNDATVVDAAYAAHGRTL